jgi:DNA replication protein DnaC
LSSCCAANKQGTAQALSELTEQAYPDFEAALPILSKLLYTETADQEFRSKAHQLTAARLTCYRDLPDFDLVNSEVNEAIDLQLHPFKFSEEGQNASLVGGLSADKSHLATAIGVRAIEHLKKQRKNLVS